MPRQRAGKDRASTTICPWAIYLFFILLAKSHISDVILIRTDTIHDLSHEAEKGMVSQAVNHSSPGSCLRQSPYSHSCVLVWNPQIGGVISGLRFNTLFLTLPTTTHEVPQEAPTKNEEASRVRSGGYLMGTACIHISELGCRTRKPELLWLWLGPSGLAVVGSCAHTWSCLSLAIALLPACMQCDCLVLLSREWLHCSCMMFNCKAALPLVSGARSALMSAYPFLIKPYWLACCDDSLSLSLSLSLYHQMHFGRLSNSVMPMASLHV